MPRSRITAWALLFACPLIGSAQKVTAIADYLKPIVSKIAADPNVGGWTWETNGNGGYLLRVQMDVTGDDRPEVFIASTLESTKHAQSWTIFDVDVDGSMRPYNRSLEYSFAWPVTESGLKHLIYVSRPDRERERVSEDKTYAVYRFAFAFPEIKESISYASEEEAAKLSQANPSQLPKLQAILLADYLTKPDATWSDVTEWKLDANDCFFRAEDKDRATKNTAFSPQVALARIRQVQSEPSTNGKRVNPSQPTPTGVPPVSQNASATNEALTISQKSASSTSWAVVAVLIVAALVFAWLVLKKWK